MEPRGPGDAQELLTPRQLEVLELLARGLTNREIAGVLGISPGTVKVHVSAVIEALDVSNRTEAALALQDLQTESEADEKPDDEAPSGSGVPGFGARPAIVILPFDDLSADSPDAFFADALVEDLTTALAAFRWFPVIARNSSWTYRGEAVDVIRVSRELGARYVVEGSVRRAGDRVRIHVQLIDGSTGRHLLAEKIDRSLGDVLVVQDEVVEAIVGALAPTLLRVEGMRTLCRPAASLDAWERFQRGLALLYRYGAWETGEAMELLEGVAADEPEFPAAHAALAMARFTAGIVEIARTQGSEGTPDELQAAGARGFSLLSQVAATGQRATELDPLDAAGHLAVGLGLACLGQREQAMQSLERSLELNPSSALASFGLAGAIFQLADFEPAVPLCERAIRLSPNDPLLYLFEGLLAAVHLRARRFEEALDHALRSVRTEPEFAISLRPLEPIALAFLDRTDEARERVDALRTLAPNWNLLLARALAPDDFVDLMVEGLRRAGWEPFDPGAGARRSDDDVRR